MAISGVFALLNAWLVKSVDAQKAAAIGGHHFKIIHQLAERKLIDLL